MRKFVLMLFIAAVSNNAIAGWDEAFSDDEVTAYADTDTLIKKGARVKMWGMLDYSAEQTADNISYQSVKTIVEYDCQKNQTRQLYVSWQSENMGAGDVVYVNYEPQKWAPITADSAEESLFKISCGDDS